MNKHELRDLYIKETGNPFPDDVAKYADWLEEKLTSTNSTMDDILAFVKSYCGFFNVSSEVEAHILNFAVTWQEQNQ